MVDFVSLCMCINASFMVLHHALSSLILKLVTFCICLLCDNQQTDQWTLLCASCTQQQLVTQVTQVVSLHVH